MLLSWSTCRAIIASFALLISSAASPAHADGSSGQLLSLKVHSPSLANNLLGDPGDQQVLVYLPPGYDASPAKRYPVVYFLHGFDLVPALENYGRGVRKAADAAVLTHAINDMIVVLPNGQNRVYGSFYANSQVAGNWEDYISGDVVSFIDRNFRTLAVAASRGLAGHSMGGFGALKIGMDHPEVFGAVFAESACCLADVGEFANGEAWRAARRLHNLDEIDVAARRGDFSGVVYNAIAAALLPNPGQRPLMWDFPDSAHPEATARFLAALPANRIAGARANLLTLKALWLEYGTKDQFDLVTLGNRKFAQNLTEANVPFTLATFVGDHDDHLVERIQKHMLPFFSENLEHE